MDLKGFSVNFWEISQFRGFALHRLSLQFFNGL